MDGQVKQGYKKTEVGVIPNDWEVVQMGNIGEPIIGLTYKPSDVSKHGLLVLRSSNIQNNRLSFENNVFVKIEVPERVIVKTNDLLICVRNGSKQLIGKCVLIDKKIAGSAFGAFMSVFRSKYNKFILFQFQSNIIGKQINDVMGATINQITNKNLAEFKIPLPPSIAEQEKIAEALSDVDALIESLEELITKKRHIKQGAMQELLTGKRRLIDNKEWIINNSWKQTEIGLIPQDWCLLTFINIVKSYIDYRGRTPKKLGMDWGGGDILALSANNVEMGKINPDKEAYVGSEELYKKWMIQGECEKGNVLLTMEAPLGNIAQIPDSNKYILSQRVLLIKQKSWIDENFLAHYLKGQFFQNQLALNATGSTAQGIQRKKLDQIPIYLPPTKAEQEAIAEVLTDMDHEITVLEEKLNKTRQIKQGMMQELLTGRIRLN